jgi:hypothetical protein
MDFFERLRASDLNRLFIRRPSRTWREFTNVPVQGAIRRGVRAPVATAATSA